LKLDSIQVQSLAEMKWDRAAFSSSSVHWKIATIYVSEIIVDTVKHSFISRLGRVGDGRVRIFPTPACPQLQ
jgi:hypothetical protein